jgi:hypothetical protein
MSTNRMDMSIHSVILSRLLKQHTIDRHVDPLRHIILITETTYGGSTCLPIVCCFSNQDNMTEWIDMSTNRMLFQ